MRSNSLQFQFHYNTKVSLILQPIFPIIPFPGCDEFLYGWQIAFKFLLASDFVYNGLNCHISSVSFRKMKNFMHKKICSFIAISASEMFCYIGQHLYFVVVWSGQKDELFKIPWDLENCWGVFWSNFWMWTIYKKLPHKFEAEMGK